MKHHPLPQQSVIAALAVLDDLQAQWNKEREREHIEHLAATEAARRQELAHRERIRVRALELARRKRDADARKSIAGRRAERRALEQVRARAEAEAAARVHRTRHELDARLREQSRGQWLRAGAVAGLGIVGLAWIGNAVSPGTTSEPVPVGVASEVGDPTTALDALHDRLDAFAGRQALLAEAEARLAAEAVPAAPIEPPVAPPVQPRKKTTTTTGKAKQPTQPATSAPSKPSRPPIVLEPDGDPLDGIG